MPEETNKKINDSTRRSGIVDSAASKWASKSMDEIFKELNTNPNSGIATKEAEDRLRKFGENKLVEEEHVSFARELKEEITEPMILLLLVVGILYSVWGSLSDAATIFTIIIILVLVEVYNEFKAERSIDALKELTSPSALVLRDGSLRKVPTVQLVPGDILPLKVGQRIPADARLIESYGLQVDESSLTGESFPVLKDAEAILPENTQIAELINTVFTGTLITQGEGLVVVVATGKNAELGRVAELTKTAKEQKTPLQLAMRELSRVLVWVALSFSILIPILGYLRNPAQSITTLILTGLSLAFVTIPEELPIIITMALALGSYALSRKHAIVKRLRAAETLGSVTVIASDKTGTITENTMSLGHVYFNGKLAQSVNVDEKLLFEVGILAYGISAGAEYDATNRLNPMGKTVHEAAQKIGIDVKALQSNNVLRNEFSFDNKLKMASYIYEQNKNLYLFTSGAPEVAIEKSTSIWKDGKAAPFTEQEKRKVMDAVGEIANMGERALAFAYRRIAKDEKSREELEKELVFTGFVSFIDPPRLGVRDVIRQCQEAGIRVIMLTGDHPDTAKAIAAQVGIGSNSKVLIGAEISPMTDDQLKEALKTTSVFARISPEHKLRIVRLLKDIGEVVAVTGDGVNDAPALREADIGITMGLRGTDVAKEAADMVLTDDNFVTIGAAVREGRRIFDNLKKGVRYYLAVKVALVAIFLLPIILDVPLPLLPIQIVLLELFMDLGASSAFVAEPEEADVMKRPPRNPKERFITRGMLFSIFVSALTLFIAVSACYLLTYYWTGDLTRAQTVAFATWIFTHIFLAFNLRSERQPLFKSGIFSNKVMLGWALAAIATLLLATTVPALQTVLKTSTLTAFDWVLVLAVSFLSTFWIDFTKWVRRKPNRG
ncbi:MAG TPA: cation-transporting P-type ATPase [Acidobacteriota bacterium]|nr:cation-transporting P-type ATPase [Acidobacteriota bacterium]